MKSTRTKLLHCMSVYVCLCKSFDTMLKLNVTNSALYQRNISSFEIKRMYQNEIKFSKGLILVILALYYVDFLMVTNGWSFNRECHSVQLFAVSAKSSLSGVIALLF